MIRRSSLYVLVAVLASHAAWADPEPGSHVVVFQGISSLLGMLSIFILSLGATAGVAGLSALLLSSETTRAQMEALAAMADSAPRKSLAVGLLAGLLGAFATLLMLKAPPLKLLGVALFALLTVGTIKGFISRVLATGRTIGKQCEGYFRIPFRDVLLGTLVFEMVFLFPLVGQLFILLACAQGFGAWILCWAGTTGSPEAPARVDLPAGVLT